MRSLLTILCFLSFGYMFISTYFLLRLSLASMMMPGMIDLFSYYLPYFLSLSLSLSISVCVCF
ncbi:hypothetical protein P175DRAFT_0242208 [Aspergillus ochraceoroseus IBT 24754]|uniref:Uncharacterized protein n=1 Tax=Aspergillus ochraceoroseus IBT 24754 TaxID=1392256 RepID=A0A2T5LXK1_9EURO|nr:uncharacterized protein P175DRAFT_0242208 [Aspergillus ochraceoroseus IBT 24754]PTU21004.1 hypothetical protein P175DRAFT_0242208 [Aspergillus ochraceoroseus IBT 24754]